MPNSTANLFYRFPRLTLLAIGFILMTGISTYINLPRQEDPTMTERYAFVETYFPGASATRTEALVTEKLETALREVPEVKTLISTSRAGLSHIQVELYDSVTKENVDLIWSEVRDKLADTRPVLPADIRPPNLEVRGPVAVTIGVAITSEDAPLSVLERIAVELRARIATLPGTKETEIYGEPEQELLIEVDPGALARTSLSLPDIARLVQGSDTRLAAGEFNNQQNSLTVEVKGELDSIERVSSIPLQQLEHGQFLYLSDIALVRKHYRDPPDTMAIVANQRGILVTTTMETGRRVDRWTEDAHQIIDDYRRELPNMVNLDVIIDQNYYADQRLGNLLGNLLIAIILVLVALLVLMGLRAALIIGFALPMTMSMVLSGLMVLDIPLHQMSVTGLIIALGLLIDNAIVVVEEYKIQRNRGHDYAEAIESAVKHLFVPLLASTATTAFAFLPIALTPGGVGDFTGSMAIAVVLSVSASFLLAMTVIPSIAGFVDKWLPPGSAGRWWQTGIENKHLASWFRTVVNLVCRRPVIGIAASLVLPIVGFLVAGTMTSSFFPPVDRNQFQVQLTLPATTSIPETYQRVLQVKARLESIPEIVESHWFIGENSPPVYYNMIGNSEGVSSFANGFVTTRNVNDPREILPSLQRELMNEYPDARIMALPFEQGPPYTAPIEIRLVGPELDTLKQIGEQIRLILSETREVTYTSATLSSSAPQVSVYPKENMARMLGLNNEQIPRQLDSELSGLVAGSIMEGTTEVPVRVRYDQARPSNLATLPSLPLMNGRKQGGYGGIPLEQIADLQLEPAPARIDRYQNERINTISGFLLPYAFPSLAVQDFKERLLNHNLSLPPGYRLEFGGEEEERGEAVSNIITTFLTFLWLMVAVIVLSLNSFRHAAIIGLVGFLSVGLALFGVWLSGYPLGYTALIGTLGLVGLAINGAIIVLSALRADEQASLGDVEASTNVVLVATRHIVSTTVTTIGGFIPLILFGGYFWPPLAMAIAGGVTGSAILALILVPAMFCRSARHDQKRAKTAPLVTQTV